MASAKLIEYAEATAEVRAVYDDIMATRKTDFVTNFWKAIAVHPPTLRRTWETLKSVMTPGALDALTKGDALPRGQRHERLRLLHRLAHRLGAAARR